MSKYSRLFLFAALLLVLGCTRYPAVSGEAYEMAETLSTVCNLQNGKQLQEYRDLINDRMNAKQLSESEHALLTRIADIAEAGDWQLAEQEARQLMLDQADR
ncbi:hypothetical protein [Blastopirellula marina]|uniref:Lipoprotein n=1 Tax=Blastopirellula marina DSM 3645 TaxID=314230 RepID=A3ZLQ4_9BACT|nr:hypothetical protein [Blastopirellula marina]EAQ82687.1 hypothetical protein DSM3645_09817 [Blastopirellula marina DSM 3645]